MKSVYTGGEKVAEFESYDELRVGDGKPAFIYEGNELVYPSPVKDGLVLWYDFSGRTNADSQRGIAEDLSGNGNHGTLQNFNYTPRSGYDKNKLLFDGVDDSIKTNENFPSYRELSVELVINATENYSGVAKGNNGAWATNEWGVREFSDRHRVFFSDGVDVYILEANKVIGKETHWVFMITLEGMFIYRNGELVNSTTYSSSLMRFLHYPITIGSRYTTSFGDTSYNSIKIYNRPLTPEEIAHNYSIEKERFIDRIYPVVTNLPVGQGKISETLKVGGDK